VDGRIERLYADFTGMTVHQGDQLALVYSPELYGAQVELIQTRRSMNGTQSGAVARVLETQERLYQSSRRKLIELGMTEAQVASLEQSGEPNSRLHLYSPISGTVIERLAVEGQYITTGEPIYRIADLAQVWLMLDLFPEDASAVRYGQRVEAEVAVASGAVVSAGRVAFIDPVVDAKTRTVGVRVVLAERPKGLSADRGFCASDRRGGSGIPAGEAAAEIYDPELAGKWISPRHPQVIEDDPGACRVCGVDAGRRFAIRICRGAGGGEQRALVIPRNAVLMAGQNSVVYVEVEAGRFEIRPRGARSVDRRPDRHRAVASSRASRSRCPATS
jgi:membrane fusion protein, copper/silver efflux system